MPVDKTAPYSIIHLFPLKVVTVTRPCPTLTISAPGTKCVPREVLAEQQCLFCFHLFLAV